MVRNNGQLRLIDNIVINKYDQYIFLSTKNKLNKFEHLMDVQTYVIEASLTPTPTLSYSKISCVINLS